MLKLSASILNNNSNINCKNINCSNINCRNITITNNITTINIGNKVIDANNYTYNTSLLILTNQIKTSKTILNDSLEILHLCRQGTAGVYGQRASFCLSRYEDSGTNSRTLLDLKLANGDYNNITVMKIYSNGDVYIPALLRVNNITLTNGFIFSEDGNNYINISDTNKSLTFLANNDYTIEFNASQTIPSAFMNLTDLTINSILTVANTGTINNSISINGLLSCPQKWFTLSTNFTFSGGTTYYAGFYFKDYPYTNIYKKTFICDCFILNNNTNNFSTASKGFTIIVNNLGEGNQNLNTIVKTLYTDSNIVFNWYNAFTTWGDGFNVYTYGTNLNIKCNLTIMILG
jgi:hypothetical protein